MRNKANTFKSKEGRLLLALFVSFALIFTSIAPAFAEGETYSVSYSYAGDYPQAVMNTLPRDTNSYSTGDTVTAIQPSQTEVTVDGTTYTFEGWGETQIEVKGANVEFSGSWEDNAESFDDEGEMEDPSSYEPNPEPADPNTAQWVTTTSHKTQSPNGRARLFKFSDSSFGTGLCAYHARSADDGTMSGWLREITPDQANYEKIRRLMYWGVYKREANIDNSTTYYIHIYLSYLRNGYNSLGSRKNHLDKARTKGEAFIAKGEPPANFKIYEWIPRGKSQVVITYKINRNGFVKVKKTSANPQITG